MPGVPGHGTAHVVVIALDADRALTYSPLSFLRPWREQCLGHVALSLDDERTGPVGDASSRSGAVVRYRRLSWDSAHFGVPMFRIESAQWADGTGAAAAVASSIAALQALVRSESERGHVSAEVPAEDVVTAQALGLAGFRLIETRVTYFRDDLQSFTAEPRWRVRAATPDDIADLRAVAAGARNAFDRYHADPFFSPEQADGYLATYAEASVRGLADLVLMPDEPAGSPPGAFFTATMTQPPACPLGLHHDCGFAVAVGRIPLVAVGPERQGWHLRLLAEMSHRFRERGMEVACMTTQATNRAVIRNCEKLGYRFGRLTHLFAWSPALAPAGGSGGG